MNLASLLAEYQKLPEFEGRPLTSVNQRGGWHSTPLHIAIYREQPDEVKVLLKAGADANAPGEYGERPLHVAINCGHEQIIETLLRAGARYDLKDEKGIDAWQMADAVGFRGRLDRIARRLRTDKI